MSSMSPKDSLRIKAAQLTYLYVNYYHSSNSLQEQEFTINFLLQFFELNTLF